MDGRCRATGMCTACLQQGGWAGFDAWYKSVLRLLLFKLYDQRLNRPQYPLSSRGIDVVIVYRWAYQGSGSVGGQALFLGNDVAAACFGRDW